MVQIKLSIAFLLAAAAIAPVVAQPIPERGESVEGYRGPGGWHHHHHHHHRGRRYRHESAPPVDGSTDAAPSSQLGRREFPEFEVRDLASEEKLYSSLEGKVKALEGQDSRLKHQYNTLETQNGRLQKADKRLEGKDRHLRQEEHHLQHKDGELRRTEHSLERTDRSLGSKNRALAHKDRKLKAEGRQLVRRDTKEGEGESKAESSNADNKKKPEQKAEPVDNTDTARGKIVAQGPSGRTAAPPQKVKQPSTWPYNKK